MKLISNLVGLFIVAPIWYYLLYQILVRVEAGELMWFLYWVYLPAAIFVGVIQQIMKAQDGN